VDARLELDALRVVWRDVHERFCELVCQQAEAGDDTCPAPTALVEVDDLDLDGVTRLGSGDAHRSGYRVDHAEVEQADVGRCRLGSQLAARGVEGVEFQRGARLYFHYRSKGVVPTYVVVLVVDGLVAAHDLVLPPCTWPRDRGAA